LKSFVGLSVLQNVGWIEGQAAHHVKKGVYEIDRGNCGAKELLTAPVCCLPASRESEFSLCFGRGINQVPMLDNQGPEYLAEQACPTRHGELLPEGCILMTGFDLNWFAPHELLLR
jgi:hypothetical protein